MNRLVIVGNGFDLANGLKSRYEDFLVWFFKKQVDLFRSREKYYSNLIIIRELSNSSSTYKDYHEFEKISEFESDQYFLFVKDKGKINKKYSQLSITFFSKLFEKLWQDSKWTNIEFEYFTLLRLYQNENDVLIQLNKHFEILKKEFILYLNSEDCRDGYKVTPSLRKLINLAVISGTSIAAEYEGKIKKTLSNKLQEDSLLKETFVLNFNYTHIFRDVLTDFQMSGHVKQPICNIHGTIDKPESIIFGYGDEMTEEFKKFQETNNDELIKHFKSFYYASGDEYHNLLGFISQGAFDVVVIGHSLGLSDRVLLNTIFENANCKFIHLFHTGDGSHFRKRLALSRHFNDSSKFREKLLPENPNFKMPRNNFAQ